MTDQEGRQMEVEVKVGRREATLIMSKRLAVPIPEMGTVFGKAFGEAYGYLSMRGVPAQGPPFTIYHEMPQADRPVDLEICAPIGRAVDPPEGWQVYELPAGTFATLLHVGPYDSIGAGYEAMWTWIGEHGLTVTGPPREVYLSPPEVPPDQVKTIIEVPVADAATPASV
jgi:effector-binding domain-containing protein